jgi:hypothetical protein
MFNPRVQTDAALGDVVTIQSGGVYIGWGGKRSLRVLGGPSVAGLRSALGLLNESLI